MTYDRSFQSGENQQICALAFTGILFCHLSSAPHARLTLQTSLLSHAVQTRANLPARTAPQCPDCSFPVRRINKKKQKKRGSAFFFSLRCSSPVPSSQAAHVQGPAGLRPWLILSGSQRTTRSQNQTWLCRISFLGGDNRRDGTSGGGSCKHGGAQPNVNRRWWRLTFTQVLFRELSFFSFFFAVLLRSNSLDDNKVSLTSGHHQQQAAVQ